TMTLLLGQPSSGKSSLMKMLAGRFPIEKNIAFGGEILYNGSDRAEVLSQLPQFASHMGQRDNHYPTLTVQETLAFALQACSGGRVPERVMDSLKHGTPEENAEATQILTALYHVYPDVVERQLGLSMCKDTIVRNTMLRGVSGGERKRVTIGEMEFGMKQVSLMDEISTGLDSAATYDIRVSRDVADFLLDLGTPQQTRYVSRMAVGVVPRFPSEFSTLFQQSAIYRNMVEHVKGPVHPLLLHDADHYMKAVPTFQNPFAKSVWPECDATPFMVVVMALLYSTTFYQVDAQLAQVMYGVIFQALLFLALGQVALLPAILEARDIFCKQRGAHFFRTLSFVLAQTITQIPFSVAEALTFGTIIYWISGFVADVGAFVVYELILLLTNILFASWFFFVAVASPDLHVAKPLSLVSVLFIVLFAGFILVKSDIPDYFIWVYWINQISWGVRALLVNQYMESEFQVCVYKGVDYCKLSGGRTMGQVQLDLFGMPTETSWIWYCYCRYEHGHCSAGNEEIDNVRGSDDYYDKMPSTPILDSTVVDIRARPESFVPVTLAFQDVPYFVPNPNKAEPDLELLKGVSGYALPGTVTALMGSSGAGKTTLMDVIAGRKTGGKIVSDILLNGYPATDVAIRRCTGYCEQMDIHCESATFREALTFSAMLRQSSDIPTEVKMAHVEDCIRLLELEKIADSIIRGSSVEQMKRLTIGVELAAAPSVLFLDEPTSGLDARSAKLIMTGIRKIASTGRTVACTIHQPSAEVFDMFDYLLLLQRGGDTVFFGDLVANSSHLIEYFGRIHGTAPMLPGANPATWMLDVIGAGVERKTTSSTTDFVQEFRASGEAKQLAAALAVHAPTAPRWSVNGGIGMVFITTLFVGIISFNSVLPLSAEERASYYRERAAQTHNAVWYFVGSTVAEIPYVLATSFV
ncbi:hypothetical protein DYB32_010355, partial [Aphanomyces invadans]